MHSGKESYTFLQVFFSISPVKPFGKYGAEKLIIEEWKQTGTMYFAEVTFVIWVDRQHLSFPGL